MQQRSGESLEDFPQSQEETVEAVRVVQRERVQQRTAETFGEVPETARQDRRLQRAVEQASVDRAEADKFALRKRFEGMCEQHGVNEVAKTLKIFLQGWR